jgi:UDP-2-acetamido-3-amino-2,3-dideoxy-glucuronate N-acetyltransferase
MVFTNVTNPRSFVNRKNEYKKTLVRRGASMGANSTIVCGTTIGEYAFIGAGAVVTRDVPAYSVMVGSPAKRIGWMCKCGARLKPVENHAHCEDCGQDYSVEAKEIKPVQSSDSAAVAPEGKTVAARATSHSNSATQ